MARDGAADGGNYRDEAGRRMRSSTASRAGCRGRGAAEARTRSGRSMHASSAPVTLRRKPTIAYRGTSAQLVQRHKCESSLTRLSGSSSRRSSNAGTGAHDLDTGPAVGAERGEGVQRCLGRLRRQSSWIGAYREEAAAVLCSTPSSDAREAIVIGFGSRSRPRGPGRRARPHRTGRGMAASRGRKWNGERHQGDTRESGR